MALDTSTIIIFTIWIYLLYGYGYAQARDSSIEMKMSGWYFYLVWFLWPMFKAYRDNRNA